jgi:hypothetical protein
MIRIAQDHIKSNVSVISDFEAIYPLC